MKHGLIALIDDAMPVVFIATHEVYEKVVSNIQEVVPGGHLAIVTEGDSKVRALADHVIGNSQGS